MATVILLLQLCLPPEAGRMLVCQSREIFAESCTVARASANAVVQAPHWGSVIACTTFHTPEPENVPAQRPRPDSRQRR